MLLIWTPRGSLARPRSSTPWRAPLSSVSTRDQVCVCVHVHVHVQACVFSESTLVVETEFFWVSDSIFLCQIWILWDHSAVSSYSPWEWLLWICAYSLHCVCNTLFCFLLCLLLLLVCWVRTVGRNFPLSAFDICPCGHLFFISVLSRGMKYMCLCTLIYLFFFSTLIQYVLVSFCA